MSGNAQTMVEKIAKFLNEKNFLTDALGFVESKTGINRKYLLGGSFAFFSLYLVVGYASSFVIALLGFLYPAYSSVKAIESTEKGDDTQWLTYWVVYGVFNIAEYFSDTLFAWFPFYLMFKLVFLCWCMAPFSWNGADFVYSRFIGPFVMKHSDEVDDFIADASVAAKDLYGQAEKMATDVTINQILGEGKGEVKED